MKARVRIPSAPGNLAEDKDQAREIRLQRILPPLAAGGKVVIDFENVSNATQSYIHALVGEALKRYGESVLTRIEFKNCSASIQSVIEVVVDYSLGGFSVPESVAEPA